MNTIDQTTAVADTAPMTGDLAEFGRSNVQQWVMKHPRYRAAQDRVNAAYTARDSFSPEFVENPRTWTEQGCAESSRLAEELAAATKDLAGVRLELEREFQKRTGIEVASKPRA